MENGPLKMYSLSKMGIFHCYVSLPEGSGIYLFADMCVMIHLHFSEVPVYLFVAPLFSNLTGITKPVGYMIAV